VTSDAADGKKDQFARHAAIYAVGNIARKLIALLMLPIYTTYLLPADYGAVGLLGFALALLEPIFGARLAQAIPKFYFDTKEPDTRRAILTAAIVVTGGISAATALLIAMFSNPASQLLFGTQQYAFATALFGINMLTQPIEYTGMLYLRLKERSLLFLGVSLGKLVLQIALNLLMVVHWQMGVLGVVLSGVISSGLVAAVLTIYVFIDSRPKFTWQTSWDMLKYSWPLWFAGIAGLYIGSSGLLYLRVFESLTAVGLLDLGMKFAGIVVLLLWTPFSQHWEMVSFRYHSEGKAKQAFPIAFVTISALMIICGLGISIFAEPVIHIMAAPAFHAAAPTVPLLTLGTILNSLVTFFYFSFLVTGQTRIFSYTHYITAGVITIAFLSLIPTWGLMGSAAGQCIAFGVNFLFVYHWSKRYWDSGIKLGSLYAMIVVGGVTYWCANVAFKPAQLYVELAYELAVCICGCLVIACIALRDIRRFDAEIYLGIQTVAQRWGVGLLVR
jgi:O-antigen/teichoic acid export membrane protein